MAQSTSMKMPLVTFAGNHLGDDVRVANVFNFESNPVIAGVTYTVAASSNPGVLEAPIGWMNFIPQAEPGGAGATLVVQQTPAAGMPLPIIGLPAGNPSPGYYLRFVQSRPMIELDCPRSLVLGVMGATAASTAFNLYVSGADLYGQLMTVAKLVPAGLVANTYYDLGKSFAYISNMVVSAGTGAPIWVGVGPTFGMEYYTPDTGHLTRVAYAGTSQNINTGGVFNAPPAFTAVPGATANDVRGSITIPGTYTAITGVDRLQIQYIIEGGTAQSSWNYTPARNLWTQYPNSARVLSILGAPQYYNASQA